MTGVQTCALPIYVVELCRGKLYLKPGETKSTKGQCDVKCYNQTGCRKQINQDYIHMHSSTPFRPLPQGSHCKQAEKHDLAGHMPCCTHTHTHTHHYLPSDQHYKTFKAPPSLSCSLLSTFLFPLSLHPEAHRLYQELSTHPPLHSHTFTLTHS